MKVEVLAKFRDKYTGEIKSVGDIFEVSGERFNEIKSSGEYIKKLEEKSTTEDKSSKKNKKKLQVKE